MTTTPSLSKREPAQKPSGYAKRAAKSSAMTTQHTPGPWFPTKVSDYNKIACIGRAWNISTILPLADFGDVDADARLIAAAPEMLAALQAVLAEIEGPDRPHSADSWLPSHLLDQVRVAVSKVEGGSA